MPKIIRKTFFWLHLVVGLVVGLGVAVMAGTGILMAYEKPILERVERYDGSPTKPDQALWSVEDLLLAVNEQVPDATPSGITSFADYNKPAVVQLGRDRVVYVNNYTGHIVGEGAESWRGFFHTVEELHRWLAATGDWRNWGRNWTGVVNLGFLVLIVSGLWLWWPKKLKWKAIKTVTVPSLKLKGKPRDWNWHNAVGFWALVPLSVIVLTGTVISYPWANNLMFRLVGDTPPAPREEGGPQQANASRAANADRAVNAGRVRIDAAARAANRAALTPAA
ncbi:MAG: PepSY-associated TM helix domain-containing protein [Tepidisphaeraceae bacterium]